MTVRRRLVLAALLTLALAACTQDTSPGSPAASSAPGASAGSSGTPQATERPSPTPMPTQEFPAPTELQGTWASVSDVGEDLELELRETGYRITTSTPLGPHSGSGRIEVDGDEIKFSNSTLCAGDGRYRWSIEGDVLRFEPIDTDACQNRAAVIAQIEYAKAE
jgi:hypothetical protein